MSAPVNSPTAFSPEASTFSRPSPTLSKRASNRSAALRRPLSSATKSDESPASFVNESAVRSTWANDLRTLWRVS